MYNKTVDVLLDKGFIDEKEAGNNRADRANAVAFVLAIVLFCLKAECNVATKK